MSGQMTELLETGKAGEGMECKVMYSVYCMVGSCGVCVALDFCGARNVYGVGHSVCWKHFKSLF